MPETKSSTPKSTAAKSARRRRIAKGPPRPRYFESADMDKLMIMFVALIAEMLSLRDRVDTHEILLEREGKLSAAAIESFTPPPDVEDRREQARIASMRRIFRVLREELEVGENSQEIPT